VGLLVSLVALLISATAAAQDLGAGLSEAEATAEAAALEVDELESALAPVRARSEASHRRAAPLAAAAEAAEDRVRSLEIQQRKGRLAAKAEVARIEAANQDAADKHDEKVGNLLGLGLAALIIAAIAVAWGWFRASAIVAALTRIQLGQAVGLCVGGGFLAVIIGAALGKGGGLVGVLGNAIAGLGLMAPIALLLARHSAEIQRGRSKALLGRERMPSWVGQSAGGVLALLCLIFFGSAIFAGPAQSEDVSAALRHKATDPAASVAALAEAEQRAEQLERRAAVLLAVAGEDRDDLLAAERGLEHAESRMASAEGDARSFTRKLAALSAREEREAAADAREAERLEARASEEAEEAAAEECNPNYSGCLDPFASDYDCEGGSGDGPLYTGTVEVIGYDEYELDDDSDGIGCDP
jgi:hypothetical protein